MLEDIVKSLGFKDEKEFHKIIANIDISSPIKLKLFRDWQYNDGTKEGILKLQTKGEKK